ncbi:hypothetical protein GQ473_06810 [archaeon]|nr:hypothetical protein [archaeon]
MEQKNTIKESDIKKNKMISERSKTIKTIKNETINNIETKLKHLKNAYKEGLVTKSTYSITTDKLNKNLEIEKQKKLNPTPKTTPTKLNIENKTKIKTEEPTINKTIINPKIKEEKENITKIITETSKAPKLSNILKTAKKENNTTNSTKTKESFKKDIHAIEILYTDGIIDSTTLERTRGKISRNIKYVEELQKRKLEESELTALHTKINEMILKTIKSGSLALEEQELKKDLDALKKTYEKGLIFKNEFEEKKKNLEEKIQKPNIFMSKIDTIFEEYQKEFAEARDLSEKKLENEKKIDNMIIKPKEKKSLLKTIKSKIFGNKNKTNDDFEEDPSLKKLNEIYNTNPNASTIADMAFIVKGVIEKKINFDEEFTNTDLIKALKPINIKTSLKEKISSFFSQVSTEEYTGNLKDTDLPRIYKEAEDIIKEIEQLEFNTNIITDNSGKNKKETNNSIKKTDNKNEPPKTKNPEDKPEKTPKKGILNKINNFFGV